MDITSLTEEEYRSALDSAYRVWHSAPSDLPDPYERQNLGSTDSRVLRPPRLGEEVFARITLNTRPSNFVASMIVTSVHPHDGTFTCRGRFDGEGSIDVLRHQSDFRKTWAFDIYDLSTRLSDAPLLY